MANFIPPAKGVRLGRYWVKMLLFQPWPRPFHPLFGQIKFFETWVFAIDVLKNYSPFCFTSPEIIGVEFGNLQTDKFFDTIYRGLFFSLPGG